MVLTSPATKPILGAAGVGFQSALQQVRRVVSIVAATLRSGVVSSSSACLRFVPIAVSICPSVQLLSLGDFGERKLNLGDLKMELLLKAQCGILSLGRNIQSSKELLIMCLASISHCRRKIWFMLLISLTFGSCLVAKTQSLLLELCSKPSIVYLSSCVYWTVFPLEYPPCNIWTQPLDTHLCFVVNPIDFTALAFHLYKS